MVTEVKEELRGRAVVAPPSRRVQRDAAGGDGVRNGCGHLLLPCLIPAQNTNEICWNAWKNAAKMP